MKKLFVSRPLPDEVLARLVDFDLTVRPDTTPLSGDELRMSLQDFDGVLPTLGDAYSAAVFDDVPDARCRILANFGVGYNHIDIAAAQAAGMVVTNTPGAVTDATADIAMTLMLMSARRAGEAERLVRSGAWQGWHPTQMLGLHLTGKTVGIVGMGRIGQAIAKRCHFGFGMTVKYFSRSVKELSYPAESIGDLCALASQVDVLVVAVPASPETRHLINTEVLEAMQPHGRLINIARGDIIDETALIAALEAQKIGGAGLDVYEFEPVVPKALTDLDNVVLLPHLGTAALEVRVDMGLLAVANLQAFFDGTTPPNVI